MRTIEEIQKEIAHIDYARSVLDERLTALKIERDQHREDRYATDRVTKQLAAYFRTHELYIVELHKNGRSKDYYDLAKQIWRSRSVCLPFIKELSKNKAPSFFYDTQALSPTEKTDLKNLCGALSKYEYLTYDQVKLDSFMIKPSLKGTQKYFLSGAWAEEVTLYLIDKTLKKFTQNHKLRHKLFWDLKLKRIDSDKDNSHDMQLDLVAEIGDRFYIFETKSGFVLSIGKWVDRSRQFDDGKNRFITCTANGQLNPLIFSPFCLFALQTLDERFMKMLQADFPAPASATSSRNSISRIP
ncbi:MAG: hypothetical protein JXA73_11875 [Acidobacteria bacterium]|nr:hypothetical protein [Acidobacteriota bacterium]